MKRMTLLIVATSLLSTLLVNHSEAYYGPQLGRFITRDPIDYQGGTQNLYEYVGGHATQGVDPSGLVQLVETPGGGQIYIFPQGTVGVSVGSPTGDIPNYVEQCVYNYGVTGNQGYLENPNVQSAIQTVGWSTILAGLHDPHAVSQQILGGMVTPILASGQMAVGPGLGGYKPPRIIREPCPPPVQKVPCADRFTQPGETYFHYGYGEQASGFQGGMRPGGFATTNPNLSGQAAQEVLVLPGSRPIPDVLYPVQPLPGTWIVGPRPVAGGTGSEVVFPGGTGPGTVGPPSPIPPRPR